MKVFNTLTGKKEHFNTIEDGIVRMYVCGLTVYNYMHIGNARPYVVFDTVRRYLEYKGYKVLYVQNFTDIDDKIINQANLENVSMFDVSNKYIKEALYDAGGLNIKEATVNPRVTDEVDSIIDMITVLIEKGYAYEVDGSVFFSAESFEEYGKLSKKNINELTAGARVIVDEQKKSAFDFVLWKPAKDGEPKWESPWGFGRPGWHIECSVMAKKYLGDTIDIHAGGADLIFPHHENEIAQSEAANGVPFARYWLHNGFINIDNKKMSKSKGNFFTLREITDEFPYEVIRFFILSSHYRSPINFSRELLIASVNSLERIKNCILNLEHFISHSTINEIAVKEQQLLEEIKKFKTDFENAMDDDFNTADAITAIFETVKFINTNASGSSSRSFCEEAKQFIVDLCSIIGLTVTSSKQKEDTSDIDSLIAKRQEARKNRDWATADSIRDTLNNMGVIIEDTPQGVRWAYRGK